MRYHRRAVAAAQAFQEYDGDGSRGMPADWRPKINPE